VERAAAELGYRPNVLASSLTTGRTKLIGLVSDNFSNPYFLEIFDAFSLAIQEAGLRALLVNLKGEDQTDKVLDMLLQYSVDGVIVASSTLPPEFSAAFQGAGLPVIHAFGLSSGTPQANLVSIDNCAAGQLAARTLRARGYQTFGFLGGPEAAKTTLDRLSGLRDAAGPALTSVRFAEDYSFEAGSIAMQKELNAGPLAEAYFCGDDVIALGALAQAKQAGLNVPDDIGFLGLNDMAMASWGTPGLTTIRQPLPQIVSGAIEMLQSGLAHPEADAAIRLFPCEVVERGTLRPESS
jgi:DNA-binding LacI/PurR family transcriptional regulator